MSNIHLGLPYPGGVVDHSSNLAHDIGALYLNDEYSDVTLQVNGQIFRAHKVILAARSQYFRALLFGGLRESHQAEVEIKDTNLTAFKVLLKYIYTGWVSLSSEKEETVLEILGLAHQYGFEDLESAVCDYLKDALCIANICVIYDMASLYNLTNLKTVCEDFMDKNALPILNHESFYALSPDLLNVVRPTSLISPDQILDAIKAKNESRDMDLQYRGYLMPGENVAVPSKGAQVLQGEMRANLLDGNVSIYDMDRGFTRHPIDDNNGQGILIKLGMQCIINHMRMMLWDKDQRGYSYYIEVSMDQKDWVRVVDHTRYHCRSWQYLHFASRVVRYIRIVGTNNTVNRVFHVVAFEAYFSKQDVELHKGLVVPIENVALVTKSALVIEGVSRARNNLLNGDIHNYDWDSGYTCHQLGSGSICVQLGQPYWLSTCKLLLWDCDDRSYSYYIEASVNNRDWELIVDKTRESCRSWQTLTFPPRAIVYFKIVGTFNTANEVFHCVHFETPAQVGSENRPRLRGFDHAVAPVRPHHSSGNEGEGGGTAEVEAAVPAIDAPAPAGVEGGVGVGAAVGVGLSNSEGVRDRSSTRPEPVEEASGRMRVEDHNVLPEGAVAVEGHGGVNLAHHQECDTYTEGK
ncbi:BTB/POZ domain-containing protein 9-like isoform X2 [Homarus americanus]|uniref:BTB/POZ domain-containing protein 9-like isoform X2 n=1 Tax=Homarus americanus TaxID=6706 RepID=UPI001C496988|nr:BTB/POZ domain-containing protein 9-like isoform X2 [Homarus americanus]